MKRKSYKKVVRKKSKKRKVAVVSLIVLASILISLSAYGSIFDNKSGSSSK